jgi:hypothetical protein
MGTFEDQLPRLVAQQLDRIERTLHETHRMRLLEEEANQDPKCLARYGHRVYSQNDEDGIIARIFELIGITNRHFLEFGVEFGMESNTTALLIQGWTGAWIEGNPEYFKQIQTIFRPFLASQKLTVAHGFVTAENIESVFEALKTPPEFDFLGIDIDYNDYWVWKAIRRYKPRVVAIEYNCTFGPTIDWKVKYQASAQWDGSRNFGASLKALELLGREKGYALVGCNLTGINAFFVRQDLLGDHFLQPFTAERHYQPGRYFMRFPESHFKSPKEMEHFG